MEFNVWRACEGGRVLEKHIRLAGKSRGRVVIAQEQDQARHRAVLVARLLEAKGFRSIPPLHDVVLVASTGETWTLAGYERLEVGPTMHDCMLGQAWMLELAAVQDLIDAERKWNEAAGEAHRLRAELASLRAKSNLPAGPAEAA